MSKGWEELSELVEENRKEFDEYIKKWDCTILGCIYGHEKNDYCIVCKKERPKENGGWGIEK